MNWWKRVKERMRSRLEAMAKANEKQFGSQRLNCCDLNQAHEHRERDTACKA